MPDPTDSQHFRTVLGHFPTGVTVVTFNFPYMDARRRAPDKNDVLEAAFAAAWREAAAAHPGAAMFAGGKSMGGRISSQAAARKLFDPEPQGLVFFGYPLHPPGKPDQRRDRHLPDVGAPMLFLHGTRDPFGSPDELRALAAGLGSSAQLEIIEGGETIEYEIEPLEAATNYFVCTVHPEMDGSVVVE